MSLRGVKAQPERIHAQAQAEIERLAADLARACANVLRNHGLSPGLLRVALEEMALPVLMAAIASRGDGSRVEGARRKRRRS